MKRRARDVILRVFGVAYLSEDPESQKQGWPFPYKWIASVDAWLHSIGRKSKWRVARYGYRRHRPFAKG